MDQGRREAPSAAGVRLFLHEGGGPVPPSRHGGEVAYTSFPPTRCPRVVAASQLTEKPSGEMLSPLLQDKGCAGRGRPPLAGQSQPGSDQPLPRSPGVSSSAHTEATGEVPGLWGFCSPLLSPAKPNQAYEEQSCPVTPHSGR